MTTVVFNFDMLLTSITNLLKGHQENQKSSQPTDKNPFPLWIPFKLLCKELMQEVKQSFTSFHV